MNLKMLLQRKLSLRLIKSLRNNSLKKLKLRKKNLLSLKQSDLGLITVDMFIGAILSNLLIRENSELLRDGGYKSQ
jgi:hypothetical protein